jgi:hypothetical protein
MNSSHRLHDRIALEASYIHVHRAECTSRHCISEIDWCVCVVFVCAGGRGGALANPAGRAPPHCDVLEAMGKDFRSRRGFVTVLYSDRWPTRG